MNTTTRPHGLPSDLPNPPAAPAGYRGVYRGMGWRNDGECTYYAALRPDDGWSNYDRPSIPAGLDDRHYIEWVELRPTPEGVADVPSGFEYSGVPRIKGADTRTPSQDVAAYLYKHGKGSAWEIGVCGDQAGFHYALRIGSKVHHDNIDAAPVEGNPGVEPAETEPCGVKVWISRDPLEIEVYEVNGLDADYLKDGWKLREMWIVPEGYEVVKKKQAKPQPAKAREFWLQNGGENIIAHTVKPESGAMHVREILPNESTLLEEAVGHLRDMLADDDGKVWKDVHAFMDANFPDPAPEPSDFDKWYANWAGVVANKEQAAAMFQEAQRPTPTSKQP